MKTIFKKRRRGAITFGPLINTRGKVGALVFQDNPSGTLVRAFTNPINPKTVLQEQVRQAMKDLAQTWSDTVTAIQSQAWSDYAAVTPVQGPKGNTIFLSGRNQFMRSNLKRVRLLGINAANLAAPPTPGISSNTIPVFSLDQVTGVLSVTAISPPLPGTQRTFLNFSALFQASKNFFNGPYIGGNFIDGGTVLPLTLFTYPLVAVGQKVFLRWASDDQPTNKTSSTTRTEAIAV